MKALTLRQPWASLVAIGAKRLDTRAWPMRYRGALAIHAAKGWTLRDRAMCLQPPCAESLRLGLGIPVAAWDPGSLPRASVVAVCQLVDCLHVEQLPSLPDEPERSFGDYNGGRWIWRLADVRRLAIPVPARGALGLWEWTPPRGVVDP